MTQTLRCRASIEGSKDIVWWVGIIGPAISFYYSDERPPCSEDELDCPIGLCMFMKRYDAEQRKLRDLYPDLSEVIAEGNALDMICGHCGKTADEAGKKLLRCSRCAAVYYCNAECQKQQWKQHSQVYASLV